MSDAIDGLFDEGAEILGLGGERAQGSLSIGLNEQPLVPIVVVFTKFDLVVSKVPPDLAGSDPRSHESARAIAQRMAEGPCRTFSRGSSGDMPSEIVSSNCSFLRVTQKKLSDAIVCVQRIQNLAISSAT
jgi:hypothetical protein